MKSRFDFEMTNYGCSTKSRLEFVRKIMGIIYISELILWRKKMGVERKVDQDEKKEKKKKKKKEKIISGPLVNR